MSEEMVRACRAIAEQSGCNLTSYTFERRLAPIAEEEVAFVARHGFSFVRVPLTYRAWTHNDPFVIDESWLKNIDEAVRLCVRYGLHVNIAFHRAPGYCTSRGMVEPFSLWRSPKAQRAFLLHWETFARRYAEYSAKEVSFNLLNEPSGVDHSTHESIIRRIVDGIWSVSPWRPIVVDGLHWGTIPCPELLDLPIVQSCRAYYPIDLTHYGAPWEDPGTWPKPSWPGEFKDGYWDGQRLKLFFQAWFDLQRDGGIVHCGEGGCFNKVPHPALCAWFDDLLEIFLAARIGFALWNCAGPFGIIDAKRTDVPGERRDGRTVDIALLDRLCSFNEKMKHSA